MGLLRLLLALAVVAAHAGPAFGWSAAGMTGGPLAVQMFYVVSGFYMALVLNEKYRGQGAWWAFAKSRIIRLYPMYLAVVFATLFVGLGLHLCGWTIAPLANWFEHGATMPGGDAAALGAVQLTLVGQDAVLFSAVDPSTGGLVLTSDFHSHELPAWQFMLVPQAWTISLELMFYALAPLLVRRLARILPLLVISLALRVVLIEAYGLSGDPWSYRFFPTELALFLAGAASYHFYCVLRERRGGRLLHPLAGWAALLGLISYVTCYQLLPHLLRARIYGVAGILFALPLALPFVFHLSAHWRRDRAIGELSYPVYLAHYLFCFAMTAMGWPVWTATSGVVVPVLTLVSAWALWRFVGERIEVSRRRIGDALQSQRADAPIPDAVQDWPRPRKTREERRGVS